MVVLNTRAVTGNVGALLSEYCHLNKPARQQSNAFTCASLLSVMSLIK